MSKKESNEIKVKIPFKERVKDWWERNDVTVLLTLFVSGVLALGTIGGVVVSKNSSDSDEEDYSNNGDDYTGFEEETKDDIFVQYYDAGIITPNGYRTRVMAVETDYENLGYLGEKIVNNFDIDPDERPCVTVNFTTIEKTDDPEDAECDAT